MTLLIVLWMSLLTAAQAQRWQVQLGGLGVVETANTDVDWTIGTGGEAGFFFGVGPRLWAGLSVMGFRKEGIIVANAVSPNDVDIDIGLNQAYIVPGLRYDLLTRRTSLYAFAGFGPSLGDWTQTPRGGPDSTRSFTAPAASGGLGVEFQLGRWGFFWKAAFRWQPHSNDRLESRFLSLGGGLYLRAKPAEE